MREEIRAFRDELVNAINRYTHEISSLLANHSVEERLCSNLCHVLETKQDLFDIAELEQIITEIKTLYPSILTQHNGNQINLAECFAMVYELSALSNLLQKEVLPQLQLSKDEWQQIDAIISISRCFDYPHAGIRNLALQLLTKTSDIYDHLLSKDVPEINGVIKLIIRHKVNQLQPFIKQHIALIEDETWHDFLEELLLDDAWLRLLSLEKYDENISRLRGIFDAIEAEKISNGLSLAIESLLFSMIKELAPIVRAREGFVESKSKPALMVSRVSPYVIDKITLDQILTQNHAYLTMGVFLIGQAANEDTM